MLREALGLAKDLVYVLAVLAACASVPLGCIYGVSWACSAGLNAGAN